MILSFLVSIVAHKDYNNVAQLWGHNSRLFVLLVITTDGILFPLGTLSPAVCCKDGHHAHHTNGSCLVLIVIVVVVLLFILVVPLIFRVAVEASVALGLVPVIFDFGPPPTLIKVGAFVRDNGLER